MSRSPARPLRAPAVDEAGAVTLPLREVVGRVPTGYRGGGPERLMEAAQNEAAAIMAEAHAERERAWAVGHAEGLGRGREEAHAAVREALEALGAAIGAVEGSVRAMEEELAPEVAALALEVATRLVRAEVHAHPERVMDVVRGALRRVTDRERIVCRVNPEDLAVCREGLAGLLETTGGIGRLEFLDDARILRGSCVLETASGDVDATFASQLARIHEALMAPPDERLLR
ncbi:MAG: FliH/SctL family protein [Thermoleophilia bacterium]|nr:FliH/SctL family protein [Thermoleophilia bacterium]